MFGVSFQDVSPYTFVEILEFSSAQEERFWNAFDIARRFLRELKLFPKSEDDLRAQLDQNLFERGWPELTLARLIEGFDQSLANADYGARLENDARKKLRAFASGMQESEALARVFRDLGRR